LEASMQKKLNEVHFAGDLVEYLSDGEEGCHVA
jgi:hypothetical protein